MLTSFFSFAGKRNLTVRLMAVALVLSLIVVVLAVRTSYLHGGWDDAVRTFGVVVLFCLGVLGVAWILASAWHRQQVASQALRESEELWSFALEGGGFAVWDWNLQTGKVALSKRGKQLFGFADDEIGDDMAEWSQRCHPDDLSRVAQCLKDHFRSRAPALSVEFRVRCKDGQWKWIHSSGMVVRRAPDGRPLRMIGTHADISDRRRREEALSLASAVFLMADEAMVVTSPENLIVSVNPAFTAITGYAPEEVIGRNPGMLSARQHSKAFYQQMWQSLNETGTWAGEVLNRKKSGEVYVEWLSIKRMLNELGQLTNHVAVFSDITERKAAEKRMRHLALHDPLTGLPNRALLTERIGQAIVRARRDKVHFGLLYFDLDKFKPVNDSFGHEVGDLLLKAVAQRVQDGLRASDTVARLGGDEFVVLLSTVESEKDALRVADKICQVLGLPFQVAGHVLEISSSIGVAIFPDHGSDEVALTRHADAAMYHAKRSGRARVMLYQPGM